SPPSSWMIAPTTYTYYYNSLALIKGTGADDAPGVWDDIKFRILNADTTRYWDGGTWNVIPQWLYKSDPDMSIWSSSWTYAGVSWQSGYEYRLTESGIDRAGNVETSSHTAYILYDDKKPLSGGTQPSPAASYNVLDEIRGTAADYTVGQLRVSDVKGVKAAYRRISEPTTGYWNQSGWTGTAPMWFDAGYAKATDVWVEDGENPFDNVTAPPDGTYQAVIRSYDEAGNFQTSYTTVTFSWDLSKPTFTIVSPSTAAAVKIMDTALLLGEKMAVGETKVIFYAESGWNGETVNSSYTAILNAAQVLELGQQTIPQAQFDGTLINGNKYKVKITGSDLAGNEDDGSWYHSGIIFDLTTPAAYFSYPYKYDHSSMTVVSGTAKDDPVVAGAFASGVDLGEIKITRDPNGTASWWDGVKWQGGALWLAASGETAWTYNVGIATAFQHGIEYRLDVRANDDAGNTQPTPSNYVFRIDTAPPAGTINYPVNGNFYNTMTSLSGSASDALSGLVAGSVKIQIKKNDAPIQYWGGAAWNNDPQWVTASWAAGSWSYASGPNTAKLGEHDDGTEYKVNARITDKAGNSYNAAEKTFYNDVVGPAAAITSVADGGYYNSSTLSDIDGTASGTPAEVSKVEIVIRQEDDFWNDVTELWQASAKWITAYSTTTTPYEVWHVTGINWIDGIEHHIWMRVADEAGNLVKYNHATQTDITDDINYYAAFTYDATNPSSVVSFPGNQVYYNVKNSTFSGTASDYSPGSGVSYVKTRIQRASDGKWWRGTFWGDTRELTADFTPPSAWEYYVNPANVNTFYEVSQEKYILFSVAYDFSGNIEVLTGKCTFYYDVVAPTTSVKLPATAAASEYYTAGHLINTRIRGEFYDAYSGIDYIQIKISSGSYFWTGSSWTAVNQWTNTGANIWASSWTYISLPAWQNAAVYTVISRGADAAGNTEAAPVSKSFTYDTTKPYSAVTTPQNGMGYEGMNTISGTAGDDLSGAFSAGVSVQQNFGDFRYYDVANSSWKVSVIYNTTTLNAGNWNCNSSNIPWEDDKEYKIQSRAVDNVGIAETNLTDGSQSVFQYYKPATSLALQKSNGDFFPAETIAGAIIPIRVVAKNVDGNTAKWYQGTVEFLCKNSAYDTVPSSYTFTTADAGIKFFDGSFSTTTLKFVYRDASSNVTVRQLLGAMPNQKVLNVKWAGLYPDGKFTVVGINNPATAGVAESPFVTAYDGKCGANGNNGNKVEDYAGTVTFISDDTAAIVPTNYQFTGATRAFTGELIFKTAKATGGWYLTVKDVSTQTITGSQSGILVKPGALDHFTVSQIEDPFTAGDSTGAVVEVFDAYANRKTNYAGTVIFGSDDTHGSVKLPSNYQFTSGSGADNGLHSFYSYEGSSITLCTAGNKSVWVKDSGYTLRRGTQTVTVNPTFASAFVVTMDTYNVTAGAGNNIKVKAVDAYGNKQSAYTGADAYVTFTSNNGSYETGGTGEVTDGERVFTSWIRLKESSDPDSERFSVTAADANGYPANGGVLIQGTQTGIKVDPAPANKIVLTGVPAGASATAGEAETANVRIRDEFNNMVYSWGGIITFHTNGTDNSATVEAKVVPSTQSLSGGMANYAVKFFSSGANRQLWIYSGALSSASKTGITVIPSGLHHFGVTLGGLSAGNAVTKDRAMNITVEAQDVYNNRVANYISTVTFSSDDPAPADLPATYKFSSTSDAGIKTWTNGATFHSSNTASGWRVRVVDANTAEEGYSQYAKVLLPPETVCAKPWNGYRAYDLTEATGTSIPHSAAYATVSAVKIQLKCVQGLAPRLNNYWQGGISWGASPAWLPVDYSVIAETFSKTGLPAFNVLDADGNARYEFYFKSYDTLFGTESAKGPYEFHNDRGLPGAGFTSHSDGGNYSSITQIEGTSSDPGAFSNITNVQIMISYVVPPTTYYWSEVALDTTTAPTWNACTASDGTGFNSASEDWYFNASNVLWQDQLDHTIKARSYDAAGNTGASSEIEIAYDTDVPDSDVSSPADGAVGNSAPAISGTSSDTQGVGYVRMRIRKKESGITDKWWDGDAWQTSQSWLGGATGSWGNPSVAWSFSVPGAPFAENTTYYFTSKSTDTAGNTETALVERKFIYDTVKPTATVVAPTSAPQNWSFSDITGTAYDLNGVTGVQVALRRDPGVWWTAAGWGEFASMIWVDASTSDNYQNWSVPGISWQDGRLHQLWARVYDGALNKTVYASDTPSDIETKLKYILEFRYDKSTPEAHVDYPADLGAYNIKIGTFTGWAEDLPTPNSGVNNVKVKIKRSNNQWWDGETWSGEIDHFADGTVSWEYGIGSGNLGAFYINSEETYYIYARARDNAVNIEPYELKSTFYYDIVKPTSAITYPVNGQYYTSNNPTVIRGGMFDKYSGIDFVKVKISSSSYNWTGSSWTTTAHWLTANVFTSSWTYTSLTGAWKNAGVYSVTTYVSDNAGMIQTSTPTVSFTYDSSEPDSFISAPVDGQMREDLLVVKSTASDALSGVSEVRMAAQQDFGSYLYWSSTASVWTSGVVYNTTTFSAGFYELDTSQIQWVNDSWYKIYSKAYDNVGIAEETSPDINSFKFVKPAVSLSLEFIGGGDIAGSTLTAGVEYDIRVRALNVDSTPALAFDKTVTFWTDENSGEAVVPDDYTFKISDGGVHNFDFATSTGICLKKAGSWSLKVERLGGVTPPSSDTDAVYVKCGSISTMTITGVSGEVTAGAQLSPVVTLYDKQYGTYGNKVDDYAMKAEFETTDTQAQLPATYQFVTFGGGADFGDHPFTSELIMKTRNETGGWTVKVKDQDFPALYYYGITVKVKPAALIHHFAVSGLPNPYAAGLSTHITVEARDVFENRKTDYTGTIQFNTNDVNGSASVPGNYQFTTFGSPEDDGIHTFEADFPTTTVKLCTTGNIYVRVKDTAYGVWQGTQTVTVNPATRNQYEVTFATNLTAGNYYNITVTAKDQFGNIDTTNADVVEFVTNEPVTYYDLPTGIESLVNGVKTWSGVDGVALMKSSWTSAGVLTSPWYVKAQWVDNPSLIYGSKQNIKVNPLSASKFSVAGIASPFAAGSEDSFYVTALDKYDNRDVNYSSTITFKSDNGSWSVSPSTYVFIPASDRGKKPFNVTLNNTGSNFYVEAWQSVPSSPTLKGWQSPIEVTPASFSGFSLSGIADPQRIDYVTYNVEARALDTFGNTVTNYGSTVAFSCATDPLMIVTPSQYWFQAYNLGVATFTVKMRTSGSSHNVRVYDINDTAKKGWQNGVTVTTEPVSAASMPSNNLHTNSLANLIGTAFAYNPAEINKMEIRLQGLDVGGLASNNDYWQGGVSWDVAGAWLLATGTTEWTKPSPSWPVKALSQAGKFRLWTKAYDHLGSTETVPSYIDFYYDSGAPRTGIYTPGSDYVNAPPILYGTAVDRREAAEPYTAANITKVEFAIKIITGAVSGTTYYWQHYTSSGAWKATASPIWINALAQDGAFNDETSDPWYWDTSANGVAWRDQTGHFVYSRAYDAAGNMENPPIVKRIVYDTQTGVSVVVLPSGSPQNYNSMASISGTASDAQGIDYVEISLYNGVNYFNVAPWTFSSASELWIVCAGSSSWSWNSSTVTFSYGTSYTVRSRMTDKAANPETPGAGKTFVRDNVAPLSYVQYPEEGAYEKINDSTSTFTIYGTASDLYSNVSKVEIAIKKGAGVNYWNGSGWVGSIYWLSTELWPSSWTYTGVNCGDGSNHRIWVKAYDNALPVNNKQAPTVGVEDTENSKFLYDITEPASDINYPGKGVAYNVKIQTYTGTYSDPNFGSGASEVKVVIKRNSDAKYWFGDAPYWDISTPLSAALITGTTFEFYISNVPEFYKKLTVETPEEKYFIYTKARDYANNYEDGEADWTVLRST
ncbi:hypothetical protein KJ959_09190, partial [bacterium]|nr:hypothetical protein [bacterium]